MCGEWRSSARALRKHRRFFLSEIIRFVSLLVISPPSRNRDHLARARAAAGAFGTRHKREPPRTVPRASGLGGAAARQRAPRHAPPESAQHTQTLTGRSLQSDHRSAPEAARRRRSTTTPTPPRSPGGVSPGRQLSRGAAPTARRRAPLENHERPPREHNDTAAHGSSGKRGACAVRARSQREEATTSDERRRFTSLRRA